MTVSFSRKILHHEFSGFVVYVFISSVCYFVGLFGADVSDLRPGSARHKSNVKATRLISFGVEV